MLALTTTELGAILVAVIAVLLVGLYRLLTEQSTIRERIARLEAKIEEILRGKG